MSAERITQPIIPLRGEMTPQLAITQLGLGQFEAAAMQFCDAYKLEPLQLRATGLFLILQSSGQLKSLASMIEIDHLSQDEMIKYFQNLPEDQLTELATLMGVTYLDYGVNPEILTEAMAVLDDQQVLPQIAKQLQGEKAQTAQALEIAQVNSDTTAEIKRVFDEPAKTNEQWATNMANSLQIIASHQPQALAQLMQAVHVDQFTLQAYNAYYSLEDAGKLTEYQAATDYTPVEATSGIIQSTNDTVAKFGTIQSLNRLAMNDSLAEVIVLLGLNPTILSDTEYSLDSLLKIAQNSGRTYQFTQTVCEILEEVETDLAPN